MRDELDEAIKGDYGETMLRDRFAEATLNGIWSARNPIQQYSKGELLAIAEAAYNMADAMIQTREGV